jgi:gentisate 1,2-dioxygenase
MVFHLIEGGVQVSQPGHECRLDEADTSCAPGYVQVTLTNLRQDQPSFVFMADESPLQKKLGIYEVRS